MSTTASRSIPPRTIGVLLAAASLLSLAGMAHHPVLGGGDAAAVVSRAVETATVSALVHGVLIALMLLQWLMLIEHGARRGLHRWPNRIGIALWGLGVVALSGAALISGFIAPDIAAASLAGAMPAEQALTLLRIAYIVNQRLAESGSLLLMLGVAGWSLELWRLGAFGRVVGGFGLGVAVLIGVALATGLLQLDWHGMLATVLAWSLWLLGLAAGLIARRL